MSDRQPVALVTGASSGIGRELAQVLAAEGHDLVLVARGEADLVELARDLGERHGIEARVLPADLARPGAPGEVAAAVERLGLEIDVLVNNAGFGLHGDFLETDPAVERDMIAVNVAALTELAKRLAGPMAARGRGRILNVASTAAFQPGPGMAVYYATKAYVLSFSVAIAVELEGTGVTVTALCPGPTRTGFAEVAGAGRSRLFARSRGMDAGRVARAGYRAMARGRKVAVVGFWNRLGAFANRLSPRPFAARVVRRLHRPAV